MMAKNLALVGSLCLLPAISLADQPGLTPAETVPPIAATTEVPLPPPVPVISNTPAKLNPKEQAASKLAAKWAALPEMPALGEDGAVRFLFGSTLPSIVCAPLYVCDIALEEGESVNDIAIGDAVRWKVTPAHSGSGDSAITHVIVKPTDAGLRTNLQIATDRRMYTIELISDTKQWMSRVAFIYPDDVKKEWAAYRAEEQKRRAATLLPTTGQDLSGLQFSYKIAGDNTEWKPLRVCNDGTHTYIQFPPAIATADAPALLSLDSDGGQQIVNYRVKGYTYVVDKVLTRAEIISGVGGAQTKVTLERVPS